MSSKNRYRSTKHKRLQLLKKLLTIKERLIAHFTRKRLLEQLRFWAIVILSLLTIGSAAYFFVERVTSHAAELHLKEVKFESRGYISEQQALELLGLRKEMRVSSIDASELTAKLQANPCIKNATVLIELPNTLHIRLEERLPLCYVERAQGVISGDRDRYFICDEGYIMPVAKEYYQAFIDSPVWYTLPYDYNRFAIGGRIKPESLKPILSTLTAVNAYELEDLPPVTEITRPKPWKTVLILEAGTEVTMSVFHIKEQITRLVMLLQHARSNRKQIRSANIIPKHNPVVIYLTQQEEQQQVEAPKKEATKSTRRSRR